MRKLLLLLAFFCLVMVTVVGFIVLEGQFGSNISQTFTVPEGSGVSTVAHLLKEQGLLDSAILFRLYMRIQGYDGRILSGEHHLAPNMSIRNLANALVSGSTITNERTITVIEGWDIRDIAQYLDQQGVASTQEFVDVVGIPVSRYGEEKKLKEFSALYPILSQRDKTVSYEGYLFPDTYTIYKDATVEDIVRKQFSNLQKKITPDLLAEMGRQGKNLHEILTIASIIQKESTAEDMAKVAGVFYNRLGDGVALQSDATVNYVTGKVTDRPLLEDTEIDSLYNTYEYAGLPPGPICNPGIAAIKAAIYPEKHDYYYFLNPPGGGELIFAKTFEEHKRNRELYLN